MAKGISPATQAALDYLLVGGLLLGGTLLWKRNRRAAVAALVAGGSGLGTIIGSRFPGGGLLSSLQAALLAGVEAIADLARGQRELNDGEPLGIGA